MKVGIVGLGKMGRTVIRHLQLCELVETILAWDIRPDVLVGLDGQEKVACCGSLEELLADPEVKLVFVTASNNAHREISIAAMRAGKAVMCEKPMANSLEDAAEMVECAEAEGTFLQIGFELRYSKLYTKVKEWIDEGHLGEIRNIQCNYICSEFWGRESWRTKKHNGGSMFGEKLSHYIDLPRWWTGDAITEVHSLSSRNVVPYFEVQDNYQASFKFKGNAVAHISFMMPFAGNSKHDPLGTLADLHREDGHELRFLIMGTKGGVETNVFRRLIKRWKYAEEKEGFVSKQVECLTWNPEEDQAYFHNTGAQAHDIVQRVYQNLPPMTSPRDSLETMRACEAVERSVEEGRTVRLEEIFESHPKDLSEILHTDRFCVN